MVYHDYGKGKMIEVSGDGFTSIPNRLVEVLFRTNLSPYEGRIVWCIIRKTYGWNKRFDRISYSQFEAHTGINRWHIARTIERLTARRILVRQGTGYNIEYGIQSDFTQWTESLPVEVTESLPVEVTESQTESLPLQEKSLPLQEKPLPVEVTNSLPVEVTTKERNNITKEYTKDILGTSSPTSLSAKTPASQFLFENTRRKRWANLVQKEEFEAAEAECGEEVMTDAVRWALTSGITNIKAIITTARRNKRGESRKRESRENGAGRRYTQAPTDEQYRRSIDLRTRPPPKL